MIVNHNLDAIELDRYRVDENFRRYQGQGYTTAVIDSGIDLNHPLFGADRNSDGISDRIVYQHDFANNDNNAEDRSGHGTHVSGIVAGNSTGVAYQSKIAALKIFRDNGGGGFSDIERALQWVLNNHRQYNIVSVNMSLSDGRVHPTPQQLYGISDELASLKNAGVTVIAASGNRYYTYGSQQGLAYPAADPNVIAVGATFSQNRTTPFRSLSGAYARTPQVDELVPISQRTTGENQPLLAPGAYVFSGYRNGGREYLTGTSMAAPHVAGAVVLAQQLADRYLGRRLSVDEVENLLFSTGTNIHDTESQDDNVRNTGHFFKRLDVYSMANAIYDMGQAESVNLVTNEDKISSSVTANLEAVYQQIQTIV